MSSAGSTGGGDHPTSSADCMALEHAFGAHNYHPMPVVISRAKGVYMFDVEGKRYMDFLSAYSACNQGHCHPEIVAALCDQAQRLTLTSRAFFNDQLGPTEKFLCNLFNYQKCLMMNSGAEAVETAIKLARRWGYDKKMIPKDQAIIITASENFHGRTTTICSFSTDPECYSGFGPAMPGFVNIEYNNVSALQTALETHGQRVCAFLVEPIQGEAGVIVPADNYLQEARRLCEKHNCLLICDEIQSGLGRAGNMLASYGVDGTVDHPLVRPDIVCLGKALSGGMMPISCVLADDEIMLCIKPGQHGSTFGGSAIACAVVRASLTVLKNEQLVKKSKELGSYMLDGLKKIQTKRPNVLKEVRGRGLMMAIVINGDAWKACCKMMEKGLLCKPTHETAIRLAPPLVITKAEVDEALNIIEQSLDEI